MNLRRKRVMLMDGQWYGYLRTASGNPLTLQNAKRLRKLTIYGNAVQDGTPSPDAPVEVQLCGDRTGNLFDKKHASNIDNWELSTSKDNGYYELQGIANGETITIALKLNSTLAVNSGIWFYTYDDVYKTGFNPQTTELQTTTMTYADGDYMRLYVPGTNGAVKNYMNLVDANLQIIQGSYTADTLPAYEPYGYKVSGRAEGLNLLDAEGIASNTEDSNTKIEQFQNKKSLKWVSNSATYKQYFMQGEFEENTQYTFSFNLYANGVAEILLFYTDGTHSRVITACSGNWVRKIVTTSANKTLDYWRGNYTDGSIVYVDIGSSMIVKGKYTSATMPSYEPYQPPQDFAVYLPEQIAKVGNVADKVVVDMEKQTAELKKNVGSVVLDGSESWSGEYALADSTDRYTIQNELKDKYNAPRGFSNRLPKVVVPVWLHNNTEGFLVNNTQIHLSLLNTDLGVTSEDDSSSRTQKFKDFLSTHQATIYAPLATPVTTDITSLQQWDAMPQVSGTVTLTLSAEVDPSGAEAVYYSKERGE